METERTIEVFDQGGYYDPVSKQEVGHRCLVFREWDPYLDEMERKNSGSRVCCVERRDGKAVATLHLPFSQAREWFEKGLDVVGGEAIARAYAQHKAPQVVVQKDPEIQELRALILEANRQNEELREQLGKLSAKRRTTSKPRS